VTIATGDGQAVELGADAGHALRLAHRAWFRAGVRRGERRRLAEEVHGELAAALQVGLPVSAVLGTDPGDTARLWAAERQLTDRRLRLLVVVPAVVLGTALGAGALLALLTLAFATGQRTLPDVGGAGVLAVYAFTGLLAALAVLGACLAALTLAGDEAARLTTRTLAVLLPVGVLVTLPAAMGTALAFHYRTEPRTFAVVIAVVFAGLIATAATARLLAVRAYRRKHR